MCYCSIGFCRFPRIIYCTLLMESLWLWVELAMMRLVNNAYADKEYTSLAYKVYTSLMCQLTNPNVLYFSADD